MTLEESLWEALLRILEAAKSDEADDIALELRRQLVEDENLYYYALVPKNVPNPEAVQAIPTRYLYRVADPKWWERVRRRIDVDHQKFKPKRD